MAWGIVVGGGTGTGGSSGDIAAHNADVNAHPSILSDISNLEDRVLAVEVASGAEVTANPFGVTFGTLDGVETDGIWNTANSRLEF